MQNGMKSSLTFIAATVVLAGALATGVSAETPSEPPPGPVVGTVKSVDYSAGTITVTTPDGTTGDVVVGKSTIYTQATVAITSLKVGDTVAVQGVPTNILAETVFDGDLSKIYPAPPAPPTGSTDSKSTSTTAPPPTGQANATGAVLSVSPLSVNLGDGVSLTIETASTTKITKLTTESLDDVKAGDSIVAFGTLTDGDLDAGVIAINLPAPPPPPAPPAGPPAN